MNKISFYFILCIIVRLLLTFAVFYTYNSNLRLPLILYYFVAGIVFMYYFITNSRKIGNFGQKVWWNYLRPIHSILFIATSFFLYHKNKYAFTIPLLDTCIGILSFIYK